MDPILILILVLAVIFGALYFFWPFKKEDPAPTKKQGYLEIGRCPNCGSLLLISHARKLVDPPLVGSDCHFHVIAACSVCNKVSEHPVERDGNKLVLIEKAIKAFHDRQPRQAKSGG